MKARPRVVKTPAKSPEKAPRRIGKPPIAQGSLGGSEASNVALPHERDESICATDPTPQPEIAQAYADLKAGLVDTDLRATPGLDAQRREVLLRRQRRPR